MSVYNFSTVISVMLSFLFALSHMKALTEYTKELRDDPIISTHLTKLYDNLLEQNLIRVIEPFSRVQVVCVSFIDILALSASFSYLL